MDSRNSVVGIAGLTTTLALIASLLHAFAPAERPVPQAPQVTTPAPTAKAKKRASPTPVDSHVVVSGRDLLDEFYGTIDTLPRDDKAPKAKPKAKTIADPYQLGILYVTVPDPIDSHLDWAYDAQVNATRRALEREGYVIDRFWVPWTSNADTSLASRQTDTASLRSHHPGVMLFRKAAWRDKRLRLIYIVGEIPTAGVHKKALMKAFAEGTSLLQQPMPWFKPDASAGNEVRIVGPAFSGSAPSLRRAIDQWRPDSPCPTQMFRIITGSASNSQNAEILRNSRITFFSMIYEDPAVARFEKEVLKARMGVEPGQIAMLQEGSTQYGQLSKDPGDTSKTGAQTLLPQALWSQPIQIPFPMHISELREEYARNPDQLIIGPEMPGDRRNVRIRVKLEEGPRLADGPPVVSDLTPPAVDAMLDDIARSLNAHHIKAVGIRATDARDVIFLGTEVRKRVRDVLLFTYGSNILYARPDVSQWLRGMLVVSTYPATGESQFWDITQQDRQRAAFSGDMAEGMYNAVLTQLGESAASKVTDYARPLTIASETRPEIWITTVGANSMLPVTVLHDALPQNERPSASSPTNPPYTLARTPFDSSARARLDTSASHRDSLIAAQEGTPPGAASGSEVGVLVLLAGLCFAWLLRDQLDPRPVTSMKRTDVPRMMRPTDCAERLESLRESVSANAWKTDWLAKNRIAQASSLLMQHEIYTVLRVVALTIAFIGTLLLLLRALSHGVGLRGSPAFDMLLVAVVGTIVIGRSVARMRRIIAASIRPVVSYYLPDGWPSRRARVMWLTEAAGRLATFLVGLGCLLVVLLLAFDILTLPPLAARNFFYRSTAVTSGVTPGIPLVIAGMLFYAWCVWNCKRAVLLLKAKAFEQMCFRIATEADEPSADDPVQNLIDEVVGKVTGEREARVTHQPPGPGLAGDTSTAVALKAEPGIVLQRPPRSESAPQTSVLTQPPPPTTLDEWPGVPPREPSDRRSEVAPLSDTVLAHHVRRVRVRLSLSIPGLEGIVVFVGLALLGFWGWRQFNLTIDALVLPPSILVRSWSILTNFDLLLRVCVLSAIGVTLFGAFRLVRTWVALREALRHVAETPLLSAFDSLPLPVARLTRLSKNDQPTDAAIVSALKRQWLALREVYDKGSPRKAPTAVTDLMRFVRASDGDRSTTNHERASFYPHMTLLDASPGCPIARLFAALEAAWAAWPASLDHITSNIWKGKDSDGHGDDRRAPAASGVPRSATSSSETARQAWLVAAGQCAAVYVVEWVEWVIHQLRNMATFLIVALILVNALLSSYPFQPQSALKAVFLGVTVITVGGLVFVLVQMNRNDVLSLITKTDPGRVTWSGPFALKLAVFILVPLGALLSTEFPSVREFLFSWVDPILRALGKV